MQVRDGDEQIYHSSMPPFPATSSIFRYCVADAVYSILTWTCIQNEISYRNIWSSLLVNCQKYNLIVTRMVMAQWLLFQKKYLVSLIRW